MKKKLTGRHPLKVLAVLSDPLKNRPFLILLIFIWAGVFLSGCKPSKPVSFKPGQYRCEFCRMDIVDMRFKAEILTQKGKVHYFDSIECMMGWWRSHPQETGSRWVSDFYHPEEWILLEKSFLLKSERLPSPMGASLSAYISEEEIILAQHEFGGKRIGMQELEDYIQNQWEKEVRGR